MARLHAACRLLLLLVLPILAAGCDLVDEPPPPPPPPPVVARPGPPPPVLALPHGHIANGQAARLLAGDPMALRFLALRTLAEDGLVTPAEANPRIEANLGALLPLTEPAPAMDLNQPVPPLDELVARFRALDSGKGRGDDATRRAERAFLLDSLLPAEPQAGQPLTPPDLVAARRLLARVERLEDAGLITDAQQVRETHAVQALMASGRLPETVAVAVPPPKPKPVRRRKRPYRGFMAEVLPNPPGVDAPKLAPGNKGPAGVQLLTMSAAKYGSTAWASLTRDHPQLAALTYKVVKADLGTLGVTYRLIAGPLDPPAAAALCIALVAKGQECSPTPFPP